MKRIAFTIFLAFIMAISVFAQFEEAPAFPGAEGFGRFTTGGRGGTVCHVTSLEDSDKDGTFRWAIQQSGKRTIVFDVSGTIFLKSQLVIKNGDVSILGQTAPGDGICIADYPFVIGASNVIIRYMRFRLGNRQAMYHEGDGLGGMDKENIVIDHCSVSWSIDECLSVYGSRNISVQWNIVDQSLVNAGHSKGNHGYGGNWGGSGASYHHNLLAFHVSRCPRLGPRVGTQKDERMDLRNCVMYNWDGNGCYGGEGMNVNIVNNYYKPGPGTSSKHDVDKRIASIGVRTTAYTRHGTPKANAWDAMWHVWGKYYVCGNINTRHDDVTADNWNNGICNQIVNDEKVDFTFTEETKDTIRLKEPIPYGWISTHTTEEGYNKVLAYAGASYCRDSHDAVIVKDVANGTATYTSKGQKPGFVNSQDDAGGWPELKSNPVLKDSDGDGIPDKWEKKHGLNPKDAKDGNLYSLDERGFYTNLEVYCNALVESQIKEQLSGSDKNIKGYFEEYFPKLNKKSQK
jgi:hypothetical protein